MNWIAYMEDAVEPGNSCIGGKGLALSSLAANGFSIPRTLCITAGSYEYFLRRTGIRERILLELNRKDFGEMRWEEMWDASLRIRNMFLTEPFPEDLYAFLSDALASWCGEDALVVRSSAADEDTSGTSFAGLHDSYVNVKGVPSVLEHMRLVWSSLWSDAALLYRQEIGLDADRSLMAVLVQEFIDGDRSGVVFSANPADISQIVLESVHGLNQGLVDGIVEPDRWLVNRSATRILSHAAVRRDKVLRSAPNGVIEETLPPEKAARPPLSPEEVLHIASLALKAEAAFGSPQDMEWTIRDGKVIVLQSRPITTLGSGNEEDKKTWYLSLRRSFDNLKVLRVKIENELIPAMVRDAEQMAAKDLAMLSDEDLAEEIRRRTALEGHWTQTYWEEFIPFAHGVRLFGQFYNDMVHPGDPYEFVRLLGATEMESLERNRVLEKLASMVRSDAELKAKVAEGDYRHADPAFVNLLNSFIERFGDLSCPITGVVQCSEGPDGLLRLVLEMAEHPPPTTLGHERIEALKDAFLNRFEGERRKFAADLLDLACASYRLRDDDNIKLGRIEAQKLAALGEAKRRIDRRGPEGVSPMLAGQMRTSGLSSLSSKGRETPEAPQIDRRLRPRQLRGQPAGPGVARGPARVIRNPDDLLGFKHGDILVCDAVDPNMTYVVPLAAAVVERRGGMLIHGAIIAREYGIPCVTGVAEVTELIRTGDQVTVDGYLGLVTVGTAGLP